jgi:hypothetical protein
MFGYSGYCMYRQCNTQQFYVLRTKRIVFCVDLRTTTHARTYNVTLRRVRATVVAVEKQYVLHILEFVFVALVIQHAMRLRHIAICALLRSTIFSHIIS